VLVVDDQYGIRLLLKEVFAKDQLHFFQAESGTEALEMIQLEQPDLILLDMKMPGMDGLELLKRIQQLDIEAKVIMMTAYGELDLVTEANKLGAMSHFTKPFDVEELRTEVMKQLAS
jgi:two-component system response regulator (stage 0 sporulation protein F)